MRPNCTMCASIAASLPAIAHTPQMGVVPTLGCFVPGYLLIVPRQHVTSFGRLDTATLAEAEGLIKALSARLSVVYDLPVLGFEYGLNAPGARRIEHAHWHLLPSSATLSEWLAERLMGTPLDSLTDLPDGQSSYIAVRDQAGALTVYDIDGPVDESRRIRLRRVLAELDPRVDAAMWDWHVNGFADLIAQTIADLTPGAGHTGVPRAEDHADG